MHFRVYPMGRKYAFAWAALLLSALALPATVLSQTASQAIQIAPEALPQAVSQALEQGLQLESSRRWGDALSHYEEALRQNPADRTLQQRFDLARLHYSLERRYADSSFVESIRSLDASQALDLYRDLLAKIDTHYVTSPPWHALVIRGAKDLEIALAESKFLRQHRLQHDSSRIAEFTRWMNQTLKSRVIRSRQEAIGAASEVARMAAYQVGLSQSAALLEFASAAAEGLDTYSSYLTGDQLRDVYSQIEGNFVGLGVELKDDDGALLIVHVIPGSPAERAGLQSGERIVAVDGQRTAELTTDKAASLLTGAEGSIVRVTLDSSGLQPNLTQSSNVKQPNERTVAVRRQQVEVPSLEKVQLIDREHGVAYVRIPVFQKSTVRDLETALWDLHRQGMRSLIIDLRGNPGGLLTSSVELADKFVDDGPIVSTRGRNEGEDFDYRAHRAGTWRVPLVVLIDGDSASASEIFAAAILDSRRGKLVGQRSFGKGSVQGIFPLGYAGAGIRLTTAKFYSPTGQPISEVGVQPDIVVRHATSKTGTEHLVAYRATGSEGDQALSLAIEAAREQPPLR